MISNYCVSLKFLEDKLGTFLVPNFDCKEGGRVRPDKYLIKNIFEKKWINYIIK